MDHHQSDCLLQDFNHLMQNRGVKVKLFASSLEEVFSCIQSQFPHLVNMEDEKNLRDMLFYDMYKTLCDSICYLYDDAKVNYIQLLIVSRKAETEVLDVKGSIKSSVVASVQESNIEALSKQITTLILAVQGDKVRKGQSMAREIPPIRKPSNQLSMGIIVPRIQIAIGLSLNLPP